ncbi:MAG: hypothetical protein A2X37_06185 [Elusimicrobia bacterium GWA2_66_18]|nr:MAG: hypothetical protein A2X37_06185 [Elusimicrobia bacterium GWA2_66_18]
MKAPPLNNLLRKFLVFQLLTLVALVGLTVAFTGHFKNRLAGQLTEALREPLISGDIRSVSTQMSGPISRDFRGAVWVPKNGDAPFSVPIGLGPQNILLYRTAAVPIYFDEQSTRLAGQLLFYYSRWTSIPTAIAIWLVLILISIPVVRRENAQLAREYELRLKFELKDSQASLAAQVAHDIRSPVAALDTVLKDLSQLPEEKRVMIRGAVGRIRDIANNLLEQNRKEARGESGHEPAAAVPGSAQLLSNIVDSLITEKRLQFRAQIGIEIDSRLDPSSYGLFAAIPPSEFKRVLSNLINNAVESLPEKGLVTVQLAANGDSTEIRVQDNGKGIPQDVLARLGQRGETHGKAGGSGLGLYHAKTSVGSWGGSLIIDSELGKGTAVTIRLPRARPPEWFVSGLVLSPGAPIVVLDDDASIHQVWQGRFESVHVKDHGVEVLHFSTPAELRSWARTDARAAKDPLYLLDYELVGYRDTGLSLAEELGIGARTILVTSRYEEKGVLADSLRLKARLIPKSLAGFVPIRIKKDEVPERLDAVLIDDDPLTRMTWTMAATRSGKKFQSFSTVAEFFKEAPAISHETPIYIDADLADGVNGAQESLSVRDLGFQDIHLATGHEAARFAAYKHLRGVVGKEPPWSQEE